MTCKSVDMNIPPISRFIIRLPEIYLREVSLTWQFSRALMVDGSRETEGTKGVARFVAVLSEGK